MDEKAAELRDFVRRIGDPTIKAFIDVKKLHKSGMYNAALHMSVDHARKHGDFSYLNLLFGVLHGSSHAGEFLSSLRPQLNFIVNDEVPPKLKKASAEQAAKAANIPSAKPVARSVPATPPRRNKQKAKASQDLMDSRLMLPGSFGMGKRR